MVDDLLPRIDDVVQTAEYRVFREINFSNAYHQIEICSDDRMLQHSTRKISSTN